MNILAVEIEIPYAVDVRATEDKADHRSQCRSHKDIVFYQKNVAHKTISSMGDTIIPLQTLVQFT